MRLDQAKRLKELETQTAQPKKLVAEPPLNLAILREAASGNSCARPARLRAQRPHIALAGLGAHHLAHRLQPQGRLELLVRRVRGGVVT
jgi:hypothetical protein